MSICVPRHIACGWYEPNFIAGNESCELQIFTESRSRLLEGGTFFRSIEIGQHTENIQIGCKWQVATGGSPAWRYYGGGDTLADVGQVELTITNGTTTEIFFAAQQIVGSPNGSPIIWVNAIPNLRAQLIGSPSGSQLVDMPEDDIQTIMGGSPTTWKASLYDADYIGEFLLSNLVGGSGGPTTETELDKIRTGSVMTMLYIDQSESDNPDGSLSDVKETRYWNGACWKYYDPIAIAPDCDGLSLCGSPLGSPLPLPTCP